MNKRYPVLWVDAKIMTNTKQRYYLGICGYSKRVFHLAPAKSQGLLIVMIVRDLYLDDELGICEEQRRCLDVDCPFNKTTQESFAHSIGCKKLPPKLSSQWGQRISQNTIEDGSIASFADLFDKHPSGGVLAMK